VASAREITPQGLADALQAPAPATPQLLVVAAPGLPAAAETETSAVAEEDTASPASQEPKP
jgi:hypothetical protein